MKSLVVATSSAITSSMPSSSSSSHHGHNPPPTSPSFSSEARDFVALARMASRLWQSHEAEIRELVEVDSTTLTDEERKWLWELSTGLMSLQIYPSSSSSSCGEKEDTSEFKANPMTTTLDPLPPPSLAELHEPLVLRMMEFFSHGGRACIPFLGTLALVCRRWRALARTSALWQPIAQHLWPVLVPQEARPSLGLDYFTLVKQRGRAVQQANVTLLPPRWSEPYRLLFEVYDARDEFVILSGDGPMLCMEAGTEEDSMTMLRLGVEGGRLATQPFSAISRELPGQDDLLNYIQNAHLDTSDTCIIVRVFVQDTRSGAVAQIYYSGKTMERHVGPPSAEVPVSPGALEVVDNYSWIMVKNGHVPPTQSYFAWIMKPEVEEEEGGGQEGNGNVDVRERRYRVIDEPIQDEGAMVSHLGYVGLILLAPMHEVAQLLSSLDWV